MVAWVPGSAGIGSAMSIARPSARAGGAERGALSSAPGLWQRASEVCSVWWGFLSRWALEVSSRWCRTEVWASRCAGRSRLKLSR